MKTHASGFGCGRQGQLTGELFSNPGKIELAANLTASEVDVF